MQSPCGRFEHRFSDVVLIPPIQIFDMKVETPFLYKCLEKLLHQFRLQVTNPYRLELHLVYKIRPARKIDHDSRQGLIQGDVRMPEAADPPAIAQGLTQRITKNK